MNSHPLAKNRTVSCRTSRRILSLVFIVPKAGMPPSIIRTILLVILCLPLTGFDDLTRRSVEIVPRWKKGDSFALTITRTRKKSVDGHSTLSGKTRAHFTIEVLRADDNGYLVGWTAGDTTFETSLPSETFLRQVVDVMKGKQIVLQIDDHGTIIGVQNWKELQSETLKAMDVLLAKTPDSHNGNTEQTLLSNLRAQWATMFATKEQVEQLCTRDARIYLVALGRRYVLNEPHEYNDLLPNPIGGDPFPTRTRIILNAFDQQSGQAMLSWNRTTDSKRAAHILESKIKDLAARRGKKSPEEGFAKPLSMEDKADIVVDVRTGWVDRLTLTRSVNLGARSQTDTTTIVRSVK